MLQEVYEFKPSHGYFPGSVKQTDIISTIDACIDFQHILLIEKSKPIKYLDGYFDVYNDRFVDTGVCGTLMCHGNTSLSHCGTFLVFECVEDK